MVSESGFDGGQENSSPVTPISSVRNRLRRFRDGFTSPQQDTSPVTSPGIRSFLETPARTSNNEPPPLNDSIVLISSIQPQQIVSRLVTPMLLLQDEPLNTQDLMNDEFLFQLQVMQQITQELDEARNMEYKRNRAIQEAREARETTDKQRETPAQFRLFR